MATVKDNQSGSRVGPDPAAARSAVENARRLLQSGDADSAAAALRPFATRSDAPPAELGEAAKVMADAGSPIEAVSRYLEAGRGFIDAGEPALARQHIAAAYELDGKNMDTLFELGRADVADGKKHDALDKFVEVLRKSNLKHLPALYEAGCLYEIDGQHNQAILAFKRVVERDKTHVYAFEHLGSLHQVRNQVPDAVANYVRAAEAAQARFQYAEAKRLAEAALAIDGANANARRLVSEAERAASSATAAPAQPATAPAAQPAAEQRPAAPAVSEVTSVIPPTAEGPVPPPPPSTLSIGLPTDVALLEQQSQAMAQLAQVQNAVAQTYRQRMALDEEIKKAQAALEALHRQQQTVDEDLSGKRDELAKVVGQREAEEAALAALGDAIAESKAQLDALGALPDFIAGVKVQCANAADLAAKTQTGVDSVSSQSTGVNTKVADVDARIKELHAKLGAARQAADAIDNQLAELAGQAHAAHGVAGSATAMIDQIKSALEGLGAKRSAIEAASSALAEASGAVERRRADADAAVKRLEALQAQRKSQFEEIVLKLTPLVGAVAPPAQPVQPAKATQASAPAQPPKPARSQTAESAGPQAVDDFIAAGKFSEAAQRAQNEANAQPKPAEYLVDVGSKLRSSGHLEDAAKLFASARDRDQNSSRARYELGGTLADMGRLDEALGLLQSVEADPEFAVLSQVAIGKCLRRQGDLEAAESRLSKALEIEGRPDEDYHQALYELADLHESKGDPDSLGLALWSYEELQTGNPNYGDVAQRVAKLKARLAESGVRSEPAHNGAIKQ
jgi:tetratricopeptide (TPR) repeat protein